MKTVFFTGVPGFLGTALLPRVLARDPESEAVCLVQPRYATLARRRVGDLEAAQPALRGRIHLIEGDITLPRLGLSRSNAITSTITEIYHLAAVYDLSVPRAFGMRVNVDGTCHVLELASACPNLMRLHYMSTCYVSGRYAGVFSERDLEKGQHFNNFYEETKYLAECAVQQQMAAGLPATIYRPSIVVGDHRTGETQKYDGPYTVLRWLLRQPRMAVMPMIGDSTFYRLNVVPRDFVVDAITHLSGLSRSCGKVYHLADPVPLTISEVLTAMARATRRIVLRIPMPLDLAKTCINRVPGVYRLMQIPASAIDYFVHPTHYTTTNTSADLKGTTIRVPPFTSYVAILTEFVRRHPDVGAVPMV